MTIVENGGGKGLLGTYMYHELILELKKFSALLMRIYRVNFLTCIVHVEGYAKSTRRLDVIKEI